MLERKKFATVDLINRVLLIVKMMCVCYVMAISARVIELTENVVQCNE